MRGLVFSIDDSYVMPFQVLFHGLMITDSVPDQTPIFIIHQEELSANAISSLHKFLNKYGCKATFIDAGEHIPAELPLSEKDHVSEATFYRLFVASILPSHISSALYLDSDAIILRSVRALFDLELEFPIAAVDHFSPQNEIRLWGPRGGNYFQAGVLLIDLDKWRMSDYSELFIDIITNQSHKLMLWDQDILNIAFENKWQRLNIWFNVCQSVMKFVTTGSITENARLIHFDGSHKPWKAGVERPFKEVWLAAYEQAFFSPFINSEHNKTSPSLGAWLLHAIKSRLKGLIFGA